jgi:hypothetical protein
MSVRGCLVAVAGLALLGVACGKSEPAGDTGGALAPGREPGASGPAEPGGGGARTPAPSSPTAWGAAACTREGTPGFGVGQALGELHVRDCDTGAEASIDEVCGASATWIFAAHTHCPTCQATAGFTDDVARAVASKNVAIVQLVYDDDGTSCAKWRDAYKLAGIANVRVYEDPEGAAWSKLKARNVTASSTFVNARRIITFKDHSLVKDAVLARIDEALASD